MILSLLNLSRTLINIVHSGLSFCTFYFELVNNLIRNPGATKVRLFQIFSIIVLNCVVFWDLGYSKRDQHSKFSFCFFMTVCFVYTYMQSVLLLFIEEKPVFIREYASKTYGVWSYYISKSIVEAPFEILAPIVIA